MRKPTSPAQCPEGPAAPLPGGEGGVLAATTAGGSGQTKGGRGFVLNFLLEALVIKCWSHRHISLPQSSRPAREEAVLRALT